MTKPVTDFIGVPPFCKQPEDKLCGVALWIWKLVFPVLVLLGTCGNILNLAVLSRKRLRALSTTVYLRFLAVSDLMFLLASFSRQFTLRISGTDIVNASSFSCVVHLFLANTSAGLSAWFLVLLTTERTYVTIFPAHARNRVGPKKALIGCVSLLATVVLTTAYLLFAFDIQTVDDAAQPRNVTETGVVSVRTTQTLCVPRTEALATFYPDIWKLIVFILFNLIPTIAIISGNIIIVVKLLHQMRNRGRLVHPGSVQVPNTQSGLEEKWNSATKMLLLVSGFFLFTTIPFTVIHGIIATQWSEETDGHTTAKLQLANAVASMLMYSNFSCNFWLYFVSGSLFKTEWNEIVSMGRTKYNNFKRWLSHTDTPTE